MLNAQRSGQPHDVRVSASPRASRPSILHITADYPDLNKPVNTLAVKNFIEENPDADHFIVSLNRTALPWRVRITDGGGQGDPRVVAIRYLGLPLGLQLATSMYLVARTVHALVKQRGVQFDVIHAHKLTFEGLVAYWLSRRSGKPFVCSLRGEVEEKVLRFKPHYMPLYRRVVARCKRLHYVSAWFRPEMKHRFSVDAAKERLLPNFVHTEHIVPRQQFRSNTFVSVMSFSVYKRKGLDQLLLAFKSVVERVPGASLDLIGRGTPEQLDHIRALIEDARLSASVQLVGALPNQKVLERLGSYAGFLLPSRNETFGMSYVEALLSGVPILYSNGTGVDGYVDGIEGAIGVDPHSPESIRDGILHMIANQQRFREWLLANRGRVEARFDARTHVAAYNEDLLALRAEGDQSSVG